MSRAALVWREEEEGINQRVWSFPGQRGGLDLHFELRHVLADLQAKRSAHRFLQAREGWLKELCDRCGLLEVNLLRSRRSLRQTRSANFRTVANCRETQVSLALVLALWAQWSTIRQVPADSKNIAKRRLNFVIRMVGDLSPTFPFAVWDGQWRKVEARLAGGRLVSDGPALAAYIDDLGIKGPALASDVLSAGLMSKVTRQRHPVVSLLRQLAVWVSTALRKRMTGLPSKHLLPVLRGPGKKARRLDAGTVLHCAMQTNATPASVADSSNPALAFASTTAAKCGRLVLEVYADKAKRHFSSVSRMSLSLDGSSFNGEDFNLFVGYDPAAGVAAAFHPQVLHLSAYVF